MHLREFDQKGCWTIFVEASIILSQSSLSYHEIFLADTKLIELFEDLYGKTCIHTKYASACTSNGMHFRQRLLSSWVFPFEQCNGVMGSFINNWMSPEMQMMRKFTFYYHANASPLNCHLHDYTQSCMNSEYHVGSLQSNNGKQEMYAKYIN